MTSTRRNRHKVVSWRMAALVMSALNHRFALAQTAPPAAKPSAAFPAPPLESHFEVFDNGRENLSFYAHDFIGSPREIKPMPLFDNAPFLRLKAGDQLFLGREWRRGGKGQRGSFAQDDSYFVRSGTKYFEVAKLKQDGKIFLDSAQSSLLFDWDVTLENAALLKQIYQESLGIAVSAQDYLRIYEAVEQKFPQIARSQGRFTIRDPLIEDDEKSRGAIFEGLGFDRRRDTLYLYRLRIGNGVFQQERQTLIAGPPVVEPWQWHQSYRDAPNQGPRLDASEIARMKADNQRMREFQRVLEPFIPALRPTKGFS